MQNSTDFGPFAMEINPISVRAGTNGTPEVLRVENQLLTYPSLLRFLVGVMSGVLTIAVSVSRSHHGTSTSVYIPLLAFGHRVLLHAGLGAVLFHHAGVIAFCHYTIWVCRLHMYVYL